MKEVLLVFFGSGLGGVLRFGLGKWISMFHDHHFPLGTFIVNVLACLAVGFVIGLADYKQVISAQTRLFLVMGFCGGFSTFSTFSSENLTLFQQGHYVSLVAYILMSVLLCTAATFGGLFAAGQISK